ncbi:MAG: hypothetical protein ABR973_04800 [Candidatus Acidiferrales bacterium]
MIQHDPPVEDGDVYLRAAKAHELAVADFLIVSPFAETVCRASCTAEA